MPSAAAAATFGGLSSMKMQPSGCRPLRLEAAAVDLGVGLDEALVPGDDDVAEAVPRNGKRGTVSAHFAPEKLVIA